LDYLRVDRDQEGGALPKHRVLHSRSAQCAGFRLEGELVQHGQRLFHYGIHLDIDAKADLFNVGPEPGIVTVFFSAVTFW
jgi:hypothetical protein